MVKLKDVAEKAGVSISTASLVLRGYAEKSRISPVTARKVFQVAGKMEYAGNCHVRTKRHGSSDVIGFAMPEYGKECIALMFWEKMFYGAFMEALNRDKDVLVITDTDEEKTIARVIRYYQEGRIDGAILPEFLATHFKTPPTFPIVFLGMPAVRIAPAVVMNPMPGFYSAIQHVADLGQKRIVYLSPGRFDDAMRRMALIAEYASARHMDLRSVILDCKLSNDMETEVAFAKLRELCIKNIDNILWGDVVFCYNDMCALVLSQALREYGKKVPDDISIIGFDDVLSRYTSPRLSTISHKIEEMGAAAIKLAIRMIGSDNSCNMDDWRTTMESIDSEFVIGKTCSKKK